MKKIAIVTGAAQGIGLEIVRKLASENYFVVLNDVDKTLAQKSTEIINAEFENSCIYKIGDTSKIHFIESLINEVFDSYGQIDVLVANAGITLFGDFFTYPVEDFNSVIDLNLKGTFFLVQNAAKIMKSQTNGGSILLMSSVVGHLAHKNLAAYAMTKAALEMLAKNLVVEFSQFNIRINTVAPGATLTERTQSDPAYLKTWSAITPLQKPANVKDIAEAAYFLISDNAKHITGQSLIVDGGWTSVGVQP